MGFSYYRQIQITSDSAKLPATQTNFPVLVSLADATLKVSTSGGHVQNASGFDIGFYADGAAQTKLDWELELYTGSSGTVVAWVRISSLALNSVFYMFYGDSSISTDQSNPTGVWDSNFSGVWHMSSGAFLKNSVTGSNGTAVGNATSTTSGQIAGCGTFDNVGDALNTGQTIAGVATFAMSAWVNRNGTSELDMVAANTTGGAGNGFIFYFEQSGSNHGISILARIGGTFTGPITASSGNSAATWNFVYAIYNGATLKVYLNGTEVGTTSVTGSLFNSATNVFIGTETDSSSSPFGGKIDEYRLSKASRSTNWFTAEYNNQLSPSTFYTLGPETSPSAAGQKQRTYRPHPFKPGIPR